MPSKELLAARSRAREWRDERRSQAATMPTKNGVPSAPKPLRKTSTAFPKSKQQSSRASSNEKQGLILKYTLDEKKSKPIETASRENNATMATFTYNALTNPFDEGSFRWVAKGKYTKGARAGEPCVCKWFKSGHVDETKFFDLDIKAMHKAYIIVKDWNSRRMIDKHIKVNIPGEQINVL